MKAKVRANPFKEAIESTPDVRTCYQQGLQALGNNSTLVRASEPRKCEGSIDIDQCTSRQYPNANRWDYALSYNGIVYFVEVHPASTGKVDDVLLKIEWLNEWLRQNAQAILTLNMARPPYYWIPSGRFSILPTSPQSRRLANSKIKVVPRLDL